MSNEAQILPGTLDLLVRRAVPFGPTARLEEV